MAIPGVHAYKRDFFVNVAGIFTEDTYPAEARVDITFADELALDLDAELAARLHVLDNPGVSSTQTAASIPALDALVVGDLVHYRAHAWLEGGPGPRGRRARGPLTRCPGARSRAGSGTRGPCYLLAMHEPIRHDARRAALATALLLAAPGCGADPDDRPADAAPPDAPTGRYCVPDILPGARDDVPEGVHIVFPPAPGLTAAARITVRGTALLDAGVRAIRVNGVAAQSADDFRHWQASVPLQEGENTLVVTSEDGDGQVDPAAAQATLAMAPEPLFTPEAVHLDAPRDRALVIDTYRNALLTVDLATGSRATVYRPPDADRAARAVQPHVPLPPPAFPLVGVALLGVEGQRALVAAETALFSVELASGKDTVISGDGAGSGPALGQVADLALDPAQARALVLDRMSGALLAVDLATGARTVISDGATGSGPALDRPAGLTLDPAAGRALVTMGSGAQAALLAVDLDTGNRALIAGQDRGAGPALREPRGLALGADGQRALIADPLAGGLVAVDLDTGDRTLVSGAASAGPALELPAGVAVDAAQDRALLVDAARGVLLAVELATGARALLSGDAAGSGHELRTPYALALDHATGRVLIGDLAESAIVAVELATGARELVTSDATGDGPSLGTIAALARDPRDGRVLVANSYDDLILAVDPATGARTVLSGGDTGSGPALTSPNQLVIDGGQVLVATGVGIMAVDQRTGDRELLSATPEYVTWLGIDSPCRQLIMTSGSSLDHGVFALPLDTRLLVRVSDLYACTSVPAALLETPAYDPRTGRLFGWHDLISALMVVDVVTGACATQVDLALAGLERWPYPHRAMLVHDDTGLLLVTDDASKALMVMDPETGERVTLSR